MTPSSLGRAALLALSCCLLLAGAPRATGAPLPAAAQDLVNQGIAAAKGRDYPLAIRKFQEAREVAPDAAEIYFDLGLAESKIPGREVRAIVWLGAYLAADPTAPNAAAVKDQIELLRGRNQATLSRVISSLQDTATQLQATNVERGKGTRGSALASVAILWAKFGDIDTAGNVANQILDDPAYGGNNRFVTQAEIARIQAAGRQAAPPIAVADWLRMVDDGNDLDDSDLKPRNCALNIDIFLDFSGYIKSLPPSDDDAEELTRPIDRAVGRQVNARNVIDQMLKQQTEQGANPIGPSSAVAAARPPVPAPAPAATGQPPGTVFRDCPDCPEMVVIPAGDFLMGSPATERDRRADESPRLSVSLRSFALGKYDVTFAEWDACVADGGCVGVRPDDRQWGRGNRPVMGVTWQEAQAYVAWLNGKVQWRGGAGKYRLPSEAEWEYAARAGTSTRFWWGDDDGGLATFAWFFDNAGTQTHPVGMKPANPFGLFDMLGNVAQWTADCYANPFSSAAASGGAASGPSSCIHVSRGGGWNNRPKDLRVAARNGGGPDYQNISLGFRLARTLP